VYRISSVIFIPVALDGVGWGWDWVLLLTLLEWALGATEDGEIPLMEGSRRAGSKCV
jgi:hypothetical protein